MGNFDRRMEREFPHFSRYTFQEIHNELMLERVHLEHRRAPRDERVDATPGGTKAAGTRKRK